VGLDWQVTGSAISAASPGNRHDACARQHGGLQFYNIATTSSPAPPSSATVGLIGSSRRRQLGNVPDEAISCCATSTTGDCRFTDIANNQLTGSAFIGPVGLDWQFSASATSAACPAKSDLLLANRSTGALQVYNIANNQLTGSASLGVVGTDYGRGRCSPPRRPAPRPTWSCAASLPAHSVYNIANNQLIGSASLGNPARIGSSAVSRADPRADRPHPG